MSFEPEVNGSERRVLREFRKPRYKGTLASSKSGNLCLRQVIPLAPVLHNERLTSEFAAKSFSAKNLWAKYSGQRT